MTAGSADRKEFINFDGNKKDFRDKPRIIAVET